MQAIAPEIDTKHYAKGVEASKRISWGIDRDVIRGRSFDFSKKFLPDGLSLVEELPNLNEQERRMLGQIQGRTCANMFGLVERFIGAKITELSRDYRRGDQTALQALVRFSDDDRKHQELFRRIETMIAEWMPSGYRFLPQPNEVASVVLQKSTWAVLGLTCHIELFTQVHYLQSTEADPNLSELYKDVFLFHWKEESQHAILDELEWIREDAKLTAEERDSAVTDLIELVAAVDGLLQLQSGADLDYFLTLCDRGFTTHHIEEIRKVILKAYRWQYIVSGVQDPRFNSILGRMITSEQGVRIGKALAPILDSLRPGA